MGTKDFSGKKIKAETADEVLNEEAFRKWQFIRLPEKFGGGRKDVSSFRA